MSPCYPENTKIEAWGGFVSTFFRQIHSTVPKPTLNGDTFYLESDRPSFFTGLSSVTF